LSDDEIADLVRKSLRVDSGESGEEGNKKVGSMLEQLFPNNLKTLIGRNRKILREDKEVRV